MLYPILRLLQSLLLRQTCNKPVAAFAAGFAGHVVDAVAFNRVLGKLPLVPVEESLETIATECGWFV